MANRTSASRRVKNLRVSALTKPLRRRGNKIKTMAKAASGGVQ
jgi:hypothetical protein